jgi:hypothetical protein
VLGDLAKKLARLGEVAGRVHGTEFAIGTLKQTAHDLAALFHQAQHVAAEFLGIGDPVGTKIDSHGHGTR